MKVNKRGKSVFITINAQEELKSLHKLLGDICGDSVSSITFKLFDELDEIIKAIQDGKN